MGINSTTSVDFDFVHGGHELVVVSPKLRFKPYVVKKHFHTKWGANNLHFWTNSKISSIVKSLYVDS